MKDEMQQGTLSNNIFNFYRNVQVKLITVTWQYWDGFHQFVK